MRVAVQPLRVRAIEAHDQRLASRRAETQDASKRGLERLRLRHNPAVAAEVRTRFAEIERHAELLLPGNLRERRIRPEQRRAQLPEPGRHGRGRCWLRCRCGRVLHYCAEEWQRRIPQSWVQ